MRQASMRAPHRAAAGEATKSFARAGTRCATACSPAGLERGDLVLALGGGVIGDLAGFAAGHRAPRHGLRADPDDAAGPGRQSSVGGKTGINTPQGKNLIGAFHQPSLVLADTDVLSRCRPRVARGYAEVAKYGLLGDAPSSTGWRRNWRGVFGNDGPSRPRHRDERRRAKAASSPATRPRPATAPCSTSATPSATRSKPGPAIRSRLLHGEASPSAWRRRSAFRANLGLCAQGFERPTASRST
jgi:hypothetical protein